MSRLPFRRTAASAGEVEKQQLQHADAAHQLLDRDQAAGLFAQLAMHGRQGRKDRGELTRHAVPVLDGRREEEFVALARIADAAQQIFDAVHGGNATRRGRGAQVTGALSGCD
ncbi:MAG TPA: hypothetical protein VGJ74_08945 [Burkholderiales bacterium]|jgi:hypothetical protein